MRLKNIHLKLRKIINKPKKHRGFKLSEYQKLHLRRLTPVVSLLFLIFGALWIIISYITSGKYPFDMGIYNLFVGFALMVISMLILTLWR